MSPTISLSGMYPNHLFKVGIGPILIKELEFIFLFIDLIVWAFLVRYQYYAISHRRKNVMQSALIFVYKNLTQNILICVYKNVTVGAIFCAYKMQHKEDLFCLSKYLFPLRTISKFQWKIVLGRLSWFLYIKI